MKKASIVILLTLTFSTLVFSDDLRKQAEQNPLDCIFFLLQKDKESFDFDVQNLADTYFSLEKYDKAISVIKLEDSYTQFPFFARNSQQLINKKKITYANKFADNAMIALKEEERSFDSDVRDLIASLIKLNRHNDVQTILKNQENQSSNEGKLKVLFAIVKNSPVNINNSKTRAMLTKIDELAFSRGDYEILAELAVIYAKAKEKNEATIILNDLEQNALTEKVAFSGLTLRERILGSILEAHLALGNTEHAYKIWNKFGDKENFYKYRKFIEALLAHNQKSKVYDFLAEMRSNRQQLARDGYHVVKLYLKINDVENALKAAKKMSDEPDNYWQQNSFMQIADYFMKVSDLKRADEVIELAFQKASKIKFSHAVIQSTSLGTRKRKYLSEIYKRQIQLKQYDKAYKTIFSINSNHSIATYFKAEKLVDFAGRQATVLSEKSVQNILKQAQVLIDEDSEYDQIKVKLKIAEFYLKTNNKRLALDYISSALATANDSCCYIQDTMLEAGKLFENYDLEANEKLKNSLRTIIKEQLD